MIGKKILGAILIGAFIIGVPATHFDTSLTNTVSAMDYGDYEKAKKNYENRRVSYELARKHYEEARRKGAKSSEIRMYRVLYEAARKDYEMARREYEYYRRVFRR